MSGSRVSQRRLILTTPLRLADQWAKHGTYYNCCGPTETTIVNTIHQHQPGELLTIGKPTPNNSVYILDNNLQPVAIGQVGTMWAGGRGVSRGYVGLLDATAAKFLQDPFARDGYVNESAPSASPNQCYVFLTLPQVDDVQYGRPGQMAGRRGD